jgi:hypothetical protein
MKKRALSETFVSDSRHCFRMMISRDSLKLIKVCEKYICLVEGMKKRASSETFILVQNMKSIGVYASYQLHRESSLVNRLHEAIIVNAVNLSS